MSVCRCGKAGSGYRRLAIVLGLALIVPVQNLSAQERAAQPAMTAPAMPAYSPKVVHQSGPVEKSDRPQVIGLEETNAEGGPQPSVVAAPKTHDLSPKGMFMAADWVVKSVMISLAFASLLTWTIWLAKTLQLVGAKARLRKSLAIVLQARLLPDAVAMLAGRTNIVAVMLKLACDEMTMSEGAIARAGADGLKQRVASVLHRVELRSGRDMARGTGLLASIGSTAPFVGLFGTVWGILNSFVGIAETQTTNLAVVAPGIAEALLATAIGLVAAIPAVLVYNMFARSITAYRHMIGDAASAIERLVSRDLDYRLAHSSVKIAAE